MEIPILYEDEHIVVINKPNNTLVHPSYYARNIKDKTLIELLLEQLSVSVFPVHRLDYKTSGVLIFAKSAADAAYLQNQFEENSLKKVYFALVRGYMPPVGFVDSPVKNDDTGVYREAFTAYKTFAMTEVDIPVVPYLKSRYSFVAFFPKTGRMHQLRKHANKISHPIIGDPKYGNRHHNHLFAENLNFPHLFLHASGVLFRHPANGKEMGFTAPFPPFWAKALQQIGFDGEIITKYLSNSNQNHTDILNVELL